MNTPGRKTHDHRPPAWIDADAAEYFITICCQQRGANQLCTPAIGSELLSAARVYHGQDKWVPFLFLLMPDHLHMLVSFGREQELATVVRAWKRYTAARHGIVWQREFFEHRLRSHESGNEKMGFILQNPVRAGLVKDVSDWPYVLRLN